MVPTYKGWPRRAIGALIAKFNLGPEPENDLEAVF
jgi:hypothetical protein